MSDYQRFGDQQNNPSQNTGQLWNPQKHPEHQIVQGFQLLRQSVDLSIQADQNRAENRKSSMKSANLVSRSSEVMNKNKTQGMSVKEDVVVVEQVELDKDEIKKVQEKGESYKRMDEHYVEINSLALRYNTSLVDGHTEAEAAKKNHQLGDNKLSERAKTPWWIKLLKEMFQPFSVLLWIASIMTITLYAVDKSAPGAVSNLYLAVVLILIILLTGTITYQQGAKSEALMDGFKNLLPQFCQVIREGQPRQLESAKLVPGDIVIIQAGKQIPADLRVIQSQGIKVDNSPLTGEAEPQTRVAECTNKENILETKNVAFFGTLCKEGQGKGIVINIGDHTMMGQIADLTTGGKPPQSPLNKELGRFVILISAIAVSMGVALFLLSIYVQKSGINLAVSQAIGIIVANVPEGLLGCITISLAITAKTLSEKNVLVKNLEAVETLGSTSCICSDKTGTLTQNKMTVENIWYDGVKRRALNRQKLGKSQEYEYDITDPTFRDVQDCAMITSVAYFQIQVKDKATVNWLETPVDGDASETALIKFFQPIEDIQVTRQRHPLVSIPPDNVPARMAFNSTNKYSLCIVNWETNDSYYCVYIKGAPEKLWIFCQYLLVEGRNKPIDDEVTKQFKNINLSFGKNGERVLGFAKLHLPRVEYPKGTKFDVNSQEKLNFRLEGFTFLGLISLMDPPKDSVPGAITTCQSAGVKVIMVTGDQPPTAGAIAKQIGIIQGKTVDDLLDENPSMSYEEAFRLAPAIVVHGDMITQAMEEEQELEAQNRLTEDMRDRKLLSWCSKPQVVFARTSPAQKLIIVRACQKLGHVVGVTGDGVNDSPAIKQGDIGISMNISGSDVTKDAADMILMDDDFASIIGGVQEGRKIFDNLKKTVVYLLTSNITEVFPYIAEIAFGLPLPLSNVFILVICIGTDILPAISFAYEEAEIDIMARRPRKKTDHLVSLRLITHAYLLQGQIATAAGFFAYFSTMNEYGFSPQVLFEMKDTYYVNLPWPTGVSPTIFDNTLPTLNSPMLSTNPFNPNPLVASDIITNSDSWINTPMNWQDGGSIYFDLRYTFVEWNADVSRWFPAFADWNTTEYNCRYQSQVDGLLKHSDFADVIDTTPCYKIAALKYAQTSYFTAVVMVQWSNVFACKQRKMSIIYSPVNRIMFYGVLTETILFLVIVYVPIINKAFGARPVDIFNLGMPGLPFSICLFCWEETRKYFIRNFKPPNRKTPNWFECNSMW